MNKCTHPHIVHMATMSMCQVCMTIIRQAKLELPKIGRPRKQPMR